MRDIKRGQSMPQWVKKDKVCEIIRCVSAEDAEGLAETCLARPDPSRSAEVGN